MKSTPLPEKISAPAKRALAAAQIHDLEKLSTYTQKEIMSLHGIGKNVFDKLATALAENHLKFKENK